MRLDEDLKERAKQLAEERGSSVSQIVEDYFRLLLRPSSKDRDSGTSQTEAASPSDDFDTVPDDLPPRTRRMLRETGPATASLDLGEDTRSWVDAAHEKHK